MASKLIFNLHSILLIVLISICNVFYILSHWIMTIRHVEQYFWLPTSVENNIRFSIFRTNKTLIINSIRRKWTDKYITAVYWILTPALRPVQKADRVRAGWVYRVKIHIDCTYRVRAQGLTDTASTIL